MEERVARRNIVVQAGHMEQVEEGPTVSALEGNCISFAVEHSCKERMSLDVNSSSSAGDKEIAPEEADIAPGEDSSFVVTLELWNSSRDH